MSPTFSVVASNAPEALQEPVAQRVRRLQAEARELARTHIHALTAAMAEAQQIAGDVADGGDAYPAGVRDLARRFAEECDARLQAVATITGRVAG